MPLLQQFSSKSEVSEAVVDSTDVFILDLDGVVWDGSKSITGSVSAINYLMSLGKKIFVCTNNSLLAREGVVSQFKSIGVEIPFESVYTSASITADYVRSLNLEGNILVLGSAALKDEMRQAIAELGKGGEMLDADEFLNEFLTPLQLPALDTNRNISAVVMGFDNRINYTKLSYLTMLLLENPDCKFIATNKDILYPANDRKLMGSGAIIVALETTVGRQAFVCGKPNTLVVDQIASRTGVSKDRICMVGDNILTDIKFGREGGIKAALVLTGVHSADDAEKFEHYNQPHFILDSLADLQLKGELSEPCNRFTH